MACCRPCCGCADCEEGGQGKCCCGGAEGTCCQEGEYCCNGVCEPGPCCETTEDCPEGYECVNGVCEEICDPPADPNACEECVDGVVVSFCSESEVCCDGVCQECCDDGDCGEGYSCIGGVCIDTCEDNTGCSPCSCCVDGICEETGCQEPVIDIDTWSWCGSNLGFGDIGVNAMGDICASGSVECEDPAATYTFTTKYYFQWFGLIETVACGGTQTTSPGSFPSIPSGNCRYIYRMGGGFGQSSSLADSCKARYWWAYVDVDPCQPPSSGSMTLVEDTAAAVNNAAISDCEEDNTPGCRSGCDTDVDDCFSTPPSIPINPAP